MTLFVEKSPSLSCFDITRNDGMSKPEFRTFFHDIEGSPILRRFSIIRCRSPNTSTIRCFFSIN